MLTGSDVTVVVPVYNGERYLAEAIDSVLNQSIAVADVIIVDDGSTDKTRQVAGRYGERIRYSHQTNQGAGSARNLGIELAETQLIAFLDADDVWEQDKVCHQVGLLNTRPEVDLVFCQIGEFVSSDSDRSGSCDSPSRGTSGLALLPSAMLARRRAFDRVGGFSTELGVGEFIDWFARASDLDVISQVIPQVLVHRRIHDNNQGVLKRDSYQKEYLKILKKTLDRRRSKQSRGQPPAD